MHNESTHPSGASWLDKHGRPYHHIAVLPVCDRSCESLLLLTCSITQMADLVQIIHREKTPVCVESIVEVVHRSWEVFVRPTSSKATKGT